jgi:hypothetical protein
LLPEWATDPGFCQLDPQGDLDDDAKWKTVLGILAWHKGCFAHEIFDDPDWMDHIMFDIDIAMHFWNKSYGPLMRGNM